MVISAPKSFNTQAPSSTTSSNGAPDLESDFLQLLFSNPNVSPHGVLSIFLLIFIRLVPIMALTPFFGARVVPSSIRIGFAIALASIFLPVNVLKGTADVPFNTLFLVYSAKEALIGFIIAFISAIPFYVAQTSGTLIDFQRGSSSLMAQDITMQSQTSSLGILYNNMLLVIFYEIGGSFLFITALFKSFEVVPVTGWLNPAVMSLNAPVWVKIFSILHYVTAMSIQLAAPALIAVLMAEAFLGIANRLAPQVQISFLGMALKSYVGLGLLFFAWFVILKALGESSLNWFKNLAILLDTLVTPITS